MSAHERIEVDEGSEALRFILRVVEAFNAAEVLFNGKTGYLQDVARPRSPTPPQGPCCNPQVSDQRGFGARWRSELCFLPWRARDVLEQAQTGFYYHGRDLPLHRTAAPDPVKARLTGRAVDTGRR